ARCSAGARAPARARAARAHAAPRRPRPLVARRPPRPRVWKTPRVRAYSSGRMNRGTVVFLALAILLAHTFAIHQTVRGDLAAPYEGAHVAYRLGRNLVYEGSAQWNTGGPPVESYPSLVWVLVSAFAARLYISPIWVSQGLGLVAALGTVIVLAQFSK